MQHYLSLTTTGLAFVLPHEEVLEKVSQELQCDILERERGTVEQFEEVYVIVEVNQRCRLRRAESRVALFNDLLQVLAGDLVLRDVQRHDLKGQVRKAEIFPALP